MRLHTVLRGLTLALVAASLCWPVIAAPTMSGSSLPTGSSGDFLRHDGTAWDNSTIGVTDLPLAAVKTTGSYSDPAWITDLAKSKVGLGNVENTALSTWAGTTNLTTLGAFTATGSSGVGVSPSAWGLGTGLDVGNAGSAIWSIAANDARFTSNVYYDGSNYRYSATRPVNIFFNGNGDGTWSWYNAPSGTAGNIATLTSQMSLSSIGALTASGSITSTNGGLSGTTGTFTAGPVLAGAAAAYGRLGQAVESNVTSNYGGVAMNSWAGTTADRSPLLDFNRSRGTTAGSYTLLANNDLLGYLSFRGADGSAFQYGAQVYAAVDGNPASGDMPGRLRLATTPASSSTPVDGFQLNSAQTVRLMGSGYQSAGSVSTTSDGTLTTASDERMKRIQGPYEPGLAEILKVKPIRYKWRKETQEAGLYPEHVYAGFSAQNVRDALGDLAVGQRPDGILSLQDRAILGALINAVAELSARNDAAEARIAALEGKARLPATSKPAAKPKPTAKKKAS